MPKVTPSHEEARRRQIVQAAARCFSRSGYDNTTMDDVCREADMSKGGVYTYFKSKEELFAQVCQAEWLEDFEELSRAVAAASSVEAKLTTYGDYAFSRLAGSREIMPVPPSDGGPSPRELARMSLAVWQEAARNEDVGQVVRKGYALWSEALAMVLCAGQKSGEIQSDFDVETLVTVLMAMFDGLHVRQAIGDRSLDLEKVRQTVIQLVSGGILTR